MHMFTLTAVKLIQTSLWTEKLHADQRRNELSLLISWVMQDKTVHVLSFGVFQTVAICCVHVAQHVLLYEWVRVGARTKLNVRGWVHCPLCFLHYFCPADFNVIISHVISVQSKTHPPSNNTPLSIRGTETPAYTEFTLRTSKSVIWTWIKHKDLL